MFLSKRWIALSLVLLAHAGPAESAPLAKPLERAIAIVQVTGEMSERGPRPLLAVFPDGRAASFDSATGRYSVVQLTAPGLADLAVELEVAVRSPAGSALVANCLSDVGVLQIITASNAVPATVPCDIGFGDPARLLFGRTVGPSRSTVFARYAVLALAADRPGVGESNIKRRTWTGPKLRLSSRPEGSCTLIASSAAAIQARRASTVWRVAGTRRSPQTYPVVDDASWCTSPLRPLATG